MSLSFNGTSNVLTASGSPITAGPGTIIAWVQCTATTAYKVAAGFYNSGDGVEAIALVADDLEKTIAYIRTEGNLQESQANEIIETSNWCLMHAQFATDGAPTGGIHSPTSPSGLYGSAQSACAPSGVNSISIGRRGGGIADQYWSGKIALIGVYNQVLSDAELDALYTEHPSYAASSSKLVALWDFTNDNSGQDLVGSYNLTMTAAGTYNDGDGPALTMAATYLRLLAHPTAASASSIEGVVLNSTRDTVIGEFSAQAFEADLDGTTGASVLLVPTADISPDGATLTTSDTPLAIAYNATYTTPLVSCTVVEI